MRRASRVGLQLSPTSRGPPACLVIQGVTLGAEPQAPDRPGHRLRQGHERRHHPGYRQLVRLAIASECLGDVVATGQILNDLQVKCAVRLRIVCTNRLHESFVRESFVRLTSLGVYCLFRRE